VSGYYFARSGSVADGLASLIEVLHGGFRVTAEGLALSDPTSGVCAPTLEVADGEDQARDERAAQSRDRQNRSGDGGPEIVELAFYDTGRDYQPGLQRARRGGGNRLRKEALPIALAPDQAKGLALRVLARTQATRNTRTISLPWRYLGVQPGMAVRFSDSSSLWRVRELRFEGFVMSLLLEKVAGVLPANRLGDGGRALRFDDAASGPTKLEFMELPALGHGASTAPLLLVAGAGASAGWRRGGFEISRDLGESYVLGGLFSAPTVMGVTQTLLANGPTDVWDRHASLEVQLLGEHMWLEGRSRAAVLQGANLALVGDELIQFHDVENLAPGRFRLRSLLRGRRGTEHVVDRHSFQERFILLESAGLVNIEVGVDNIGQKIFIRPLDFILSGYGQTQLTFTGAGLRPLSPAHFKLVRDGGDIVASWIRRSRNGFSWLDFVDVPPGDVEDSYVIKIYMNGNIVREIITKENFYRYCENYRLSDGIYCDIKFEVFQINNLIGPGISSFAEINIYQ